MLYYNLFNIVGQFVKQLFRSNGYYVVRGYEEHCEGAAEVLNIKCTFCRSDSRPDIKNTI